MNSVMKKFSTLLILILLLVGCKTEVVGLQQDQSFTYDSALQGAFVAAAVTSLADDLNDRQRMLYSEILAREFVDERPEFTLFRSGVLISSYSLQQYRAWLNNYQLSGEIADTFANAIRKTYPHARFVILCRIEENRVAQHHSETETDVADSEEDRKKGEFEFVQVDVTLTTSRQVGATLSIFELQQNKVVWSGYVAKSEANSSSSSRTFDKHNRWREEFVDSFIDALIGVDNQGYPQAPAFEKVLASVFEGFAENMPEKNR